MIMFASKFLIGLLVGVPLAVGSLTRVACAQTASTPDQIRGLKSDPKLHAMLPEKIRTSGVLKLGTDAHYAPCESFTDDGKTMVGWEPDFWNALGQILGVRVEAESTAFAGLIPGVVSGRYDTAMECMTDTAERQKQIMFVDVMMARSGAFALESTRATEDPLWFCGLKTATQQGTIFSQLVDKIMTPHCQSNNKPSVENGVFPSADAALLALYSGRVDFVVNNEMTVTELKKKAPKPIKLVSIPQFPTNFTGMVTNKDNRELAEAMLAATKVMQREGVYDQIVEKWGLQNLKLTEPGINRAPGG